MKAQAPSLKICSRASTRWLRHWSWSFFGIWILDLLAHDEGDPHHQSESGLADDWAG
jgi:hypothetical protein